MIRQMAAEKKPKQSNNRESFEKAAAELGEARPLDDVLRQIVKPEKKKQKSGGPEDRRESDK